MLILKVNSIAGIFNGVQNQPDEVKLGNDEDELENDEGYRAYSQLLRFVESITLTDPSQALPAIREKMDLDGLLTYVAVSSLLHIGDITDEVFFFGLKGSHDWSAYPFRTDLALSMFLWCCGGRTS